MQLLLCQERRPVQVGIELGSSKGDFFFEKFEGLVRLVPLQDHFQGGVSSVLKAISVADISAFIAELSCVVWDKLTVLYSVELRLACSGEGRA